MLDKMVWTRDTKDRSLTHVGAKEGRIVRMKIIAYRRIELLQELLERRVGVLFGERAIGARGVAVPNVDEDIIQWLACLHVHDANVKE